VDALLRDARHAARRLVRSPGFTAVAVSTLALGVAANAALFGLVNGVLLRPLPYGDPDRLVSLYTRYVPTSGYDFPWFSLSGPELLDVRGQVGAFGEVAAYVFDSVNLAGDADAERVPAVWATANLFRLLGRAPALGRDFATGEDAPGAPCATILSDGLWRERFGGDPAAVGRDVRLDGEPCRVVGVMPPDAGFPGEEPRLWRPLALDPAGPAWGRASHPYWAVARLAPGATPAGAAAELEALRARWEAEFPGHYAGGGHFVVARPLAEDLTAEVRPALLVLLGAVGAVLLVICANLTGLAVLRAESRRREMAVRAALGGGRVALARLALVESVLVALAGGVLGALAAGPLARAVTDFYPGSLPRAAGADPDGPVLAFTAAVSLLAALVVGLVPAIGSSAAGLERLLRGGGRTSTGRRAGTRLRRGLVVAQVAIGLVVAAAAALVARSYVQLRGEELGVDPDGVLAFTLEAPEASYPEAGDVRAFFASVRNRLAALPSVESVGVISDLPLESAGPADNFQIEGRPQPAAGETGWNARYLLVGPGALETLRLRVRAGRALDGRDVHGAPSAAVVNEAAVRTFWGGRPPLGRRIRYGEDGAWLTIVGVVADVRSLGLDVPAPPAVYVAHDQTPRPLYPGRMMNVVLRGRGDPLALAPQARAAVREIDPAVPLAAPRTMGGVVDAATGRPRFMMVVLLVFAATVLVLAGLGVYGVVAHAVLHRAREIGVRVALGARGADVVRMVLGQGLAMAALGVGAGLVAALAATRFLSGLLYGVTPTDPPTFAAVAVTLLGAGLLASWLPARRAVRVDPARALRAE
jgi:putative ABC transport system permease protein